MKPRFYAPALEGPSGAVILPPDEGRHLARVMRLGVGAEVAVFDGRGREFRARVASVLKDVVRLELQEPIEPPAEPRVPVTLVQAVLKGDAMDDAVRDATMMGVSAVVPVLTTHMAVTGRALESGKAVERWRRVALSSAKQCRRATLPPIHDPQAIESWFASAREDVRFLLVEPSSPCQPRPLRAWLAHPPPASAAVVVGPEGGWDAREIDRAVASGCVPVSLGALTLRADAVPIAALAACRIVFGED